MFDIDFFDKIDIEYDITCMISNYNVNKNIIHGYVFSMYVSIILLYISYVISLNYIFQTWNIKVITLTKIQYSIKTIT